MSDIFTSPRALFLATCLPFFGFFTLFAEAILPAFLAGSLTPPRAIMRFFDGVGEESGLRFIKALVEKWPLALYYIVSELYSSVSIGILFWQFANHVTDVAQAKRFYPLFGQVSSLAPIVAGHLVFAVTKDRSFAESFRVLTVSLVAAGFLICALHGYAISKYSLPPQGDGAASGKKKKAKPGLVQSYKFLAQSRYLRNLATCVVSYGLAINFTEIIWKSMVRKGLPDARDYQRFMARVSSLVGASTFFVIFLGSNLVKHLGWKVGALATPTTMGILALPLYLAVFAAHLKGTQSGVRTAMIVGAVQSVLSKATKYAVFDPTTQMAYIPLDEDSKVKGKAAIDVLGSRLGKSGGSLLQQLCIVLFGSINDSAPALFGMFYGVIVMWVTAVQSLSGQFTKLSREAGLDMKN
uniref:ADP,ATP carrier protein n=1 Tax=Phaeomonas parva TaxID=124430 RepID=A0A7S1UAW6_9STRA|mmetsp:Transcript_38819/g.121710  ORF Transcript_38819/g.121710 Transcript_38819/m.121710 type:complete len:410 (+) Transcript_38819:213-1442(+)